MKRETAEKIAAAETGIGLKDAQEVVTAFLRTVAQCPVGGNGSNRFAYRKRVEVPVEGSGRPSELVYVATGQDGNCPLCGSDGKGTPTG